MAVWVYASPDPVASVSLQNQATAMAVTGLTVYAGGRTTTGALVAVSTNGGKGYSLTATRPFPTVAQGVAAIATVAGRIVVLGAAGDISHSDDGGATWVQPGFQPFHSGAGYTLLLTGTTLWAGGQPQAGSIVPPSNGGLAFSTDSGTTWHLPSGLPFQDVGQPNQCTALAGDSGYAVAGGRDFGSAVTIYYTTDSGTTWTAAAAEPFANTPPTAALTLASPHIVGQKRIVVTGPTLKYSDDDGSTWTVPSGLPAGLAFTGAVTSIGAQVVAVVNTATTGLLYTSADSGDSWTAMNSSPFRAATDNVLGVAGTTLLAGGITVDFAHTLAYYGGTPPTRQYPRDDNLALGSVRQRGPGVNPSSRQGSIRQGWTGTYS